MAMSSLIVQALGIWILFVVVAIVNGAIREKLLVRLAGEYLAHLMAVLVLSLAVFAITGVFVRQTRISDAGILLVIGGLWFTHSSRPSCRANSWGIKAGCHPWSYSVMKPHLQVVAAVREDRWRT